MTAPISAAGSSISGDPRCIDVSQIDGRFIGIHVLRTVIGVNLNAGADGRPKTITVNGVTRMRVSPQARKRAMREWIHQFLNGPEIAVRTRHLPGAAAERLAKLRGIDTDLALNTVIALLLSTTKAKIDPEIPHRTSDIVFAAGTTPELLAGVADDLFDELAEVAEAIAKTREAFADYQEQRKAAGTTKLKTASGKEAKAPEFSVKENKAWMPLVAKAFNPGASLEIALNGRMLTALPDGGDVYGALSVANSHGVSAIEREIDYWTVADDWQDGGFTDEKGAAHIGDRHIASATLYEWAAIDREQLRINLAATSGLTGAELEAAAINGEQLGIASAAWAVPTAGAHSSGSIAAPTLVVVTVGDTPPLASASFSDALPNGSGVVDEAAARLAAFIDKSATGRFPINGGTAIWFSPTGSPAPTFTGPITVEE